MQQQSITDTLVRKTQYLLGRVHYYQDLVNRYIENCRFEKGVEIGAFHLKPEYRDYHHLQDIEEYKGVEASYRIKKLLNHIETHLQTIKIYLENQDVYVHRRDFLSRLPRIINYIERCQSLLRNRHKKYDLDRLVFHDIEANKLEKSPMTKSLVRRVYQYLLPSKTSPKRPTTTASSSRVAR